MIRNFATIIIMTPKGLLRNMELSDALLRNQNYILIAKFVNNFPSKSLRTIIVCTLSFYLNTVYSRNTSTIFL